MSVTLLTVTKTAAEDKQEVTGKRKSFGSSKIFVGESGVTYSDAGGISWKMKQAGEGVAVNASTPALHRQSAFDMDSSALYRTLLVISVLSILIGIWIVIRLLRQKQNGSRIRRYDILPAKQLVSDQIASEDSDDELFGTLRITDDSNRRLVTETHVGMR